MGHGSGPSLAAGGSAERLHSRRASISAASRSPPTRGAMPENDSHARRTRCELLDRRPIALCRHQEGQAVRDAREGRRRPQSRAPHPLGAKLEHTSAKQRIVYGKLILTSLPQSSAIDLWDSTDPIGVIPPSMWAPRRRGWFARSGTCSQLGTCGLAPTRGGPSQIHPSPWESPSVSADRRGRGRPTLSS